MVGIRRDAQHTAQAGVATQALSRIPWQTPSTSRRSFSPTARSSSTTARRSITAAQHGHRAGEDRARAAASASRRARGANGDAALVSADTRLRRCRRTTGCRASRRADARGNRLYFAGRRRHALLPRRTPTPPSGDDADQLVFYGSDGYAADAATFNATVFINTPLTADAARQHLLRLPGRPAPTPAGLASGIARVGADGSGTLGRRRDAPPATPRSPRSRTNSAPALSPGRPDALRRGEHRRRRRHRGGYLLALDSTTLATNGQRRLLTIPTTGNARRHRRRRHRVADGRARRRRLLRRPRDRRSRAQRPRLAAALRRRPARRQARRARSAGTTRRRSCRRRWCRRTAGRRRTCS